MGTAQRRVVQAWLIQTVRSGGSRHPNAKLFAVRCRFADVSGAAFKELSSAAQQVRATMGPVSKIRSKKEGDAREATVYVTGREAFEKFLGSAEAIQGVEDRRGYG